MYPKERGRTAGRACMWCASTVTTIKPVYSLQRHLNVWNVGASAKNALHCKCLVCGLRQRHVFQVEPDNYLPLRDDIQKPLTNTAAFVLDEKLAFLTCK